MLTTRWIPPGRSSFLAAGVCLFSVLCSHSNGNAAETDSAVERDLKLTCLARQTLLNDKILGPLGLNLAVDVRNRRATLWGSVPSATLAKHALEVIRKLPEIHSVTDELTIEPIPDAPSSLPKPKFVPSKAPPIRETPPSNAAGELAGNRKPPGPPSGTVVPWRPVGKPDGSPALPTAEAIMPAIVIPTPTASKDNETGSRNLPAGINLIEAIDRLRRTTEGSYDERYRHLQAQVRGSVVYLRGNVRHWDDALQLARAISRLPGVEQVLLQDIQTVR
jgi:hypothetical protein